MDAQPAPAVAPIIPRACADLATLILARGDVRTHPRQAILRRQLRATMETERRPVVLASGFRFALGKGPVWGFEGLPLCVSVVDVEMWRAAEAARKKARRKR
jgi:hypothetical protein